MQNITTVLMIALSEIKKPREISSFSTCAISKNIALSRAMPITSPARNTDERYIEIFPSHCLGNMGFFHTQDIEDAEFLLSPLH